MRFRLRVPSRARLAGHRGQAVQHGRASPKPGVRYGHTPLGAPGSGRRTIDCLRRRYADQVLLPCCRCRERIGRPARRARSDRDTLTWAARRRFARSISSPLVSSTGPAAPRTSSSCPDEVAYEVGFEDMARRVPDVTKIGPLPRWQAERTLADILDDVIEEVRAEREALALVGDN